MLVTTTRRAGAYHRDDLPYFKDEWIQNFQDELMDGDEIKSVKFLRVEPVPQEDCDERNRIDFDGDPILSPKWDVYLLFEVTEKL